MINYLKNILIRLSGSVKRFIRLLRVFFIHNKKAVKYCSLSLFSAAAIAVIALFLYGKPINIDFSFIDFNIKTEATSEITAEPTAEPTQSPVPHIYGDSALIVLDASQFSDNSYIDQKATSFGEENYYTTEYYKVDPDDFVSTYYEMAEAGNTPNVVIASNDLIMQLEGFQDISSVASEIAFNTAADGAVTAYKIPIALEMYGYFFRTDLLDAAEYEVPREYSWLESLAERLRSDNAYDYIMYSGTYDDGTELAESFLTSRYGFGFAGGDIGGGLMISQAISTVFDDGTNILYAIQTMWDELYLPPNTSYADDESIIQAYLNDALAGVYASGTLYEELYSNATLYYNTEVKSYLGTDAVFTANAIYCAVPEGTDLDVASNFLSQLYSGGELDLIIAQNHTGYLPIGNYVNDASPWKEALTTESEVIFYNDDYYIKTINRIIMASEDVEAALISAGE